MAENYRLVAIDPMRMGEVWEVLLPLLQRVVEGSNHRFCIESLLHQLTTHEIQIWAIVGPDGMDAVVGTQIGVEVSGLKVCTVRFVTGENARTWTYLIEELEEYARQNGCDRMDTWARKGWAKHLPEYRMTHVLLERDL